MHVSEDLSDSGVVNDGDTIFIERFILVIGRLMIYCMSSED